MFVTFKNIQFLFVNYIINALPIDSLSFINKVNNFAYFFLIMLRSINKQPRIPAHKKYTEKVVRKLGRPGNTWQDCVELFSEKYYQIEIHFN
jgi:hypothetical protein